MWTGILWLWIETSDWHCKLGIEIVGSVRGTELQEWLRNYQLLKKHFFMALGNIKMTGQMADMY